MIGLLRCKPTYCILKDFKMDDKQLHLIDLYARIPYGVKVLYRGAAVDLPRYQRSVKLSDCIPYLRPMSRMTKEEQKEFGNLVGLWKYKETSHFANCLPNLSGEFGKTLITEVTTVKAIDWLNNHHFDYRGLIEKGLALEAPEEMYYDIKL